MGKRNHPLARALSCVEKLMKHPDAIALFNEPVDATSLGLTDYYEVVPRPMDLGTICTRLKVGEASSWQTCQYSNPDEVLDDIQLVWRNCVAYNNRPDEQAISNTAIELNNQTLISWEKAGLGGVEGRGIGPLNGLGQAHSVQPVKLKETALNNAYNVVLGTFFSWWRFVCEFNQ